MRSLWYVLRKINVYHQQPCLLEHLSAKPRLIGSDISQAAHLAISSVSTQKESGIGGDVRG